MESSPLFVKSYDFLLWLLPQTHRFPRVYRFSLTERLVASALNMHGAFIAAGKYRGRTRKTHLLQADVFLEEVRHWLRLSRDLDMLTPRRYAHAVQGLTEIGRLLGAWLKKEGVSPS